MDIELKKKVSSAVLDVDKAKRALVAGKTIVELYSAYTEEFSRVPEMTGELLKELQASAKSLLGYVWPEVRLAVLSKWAAERGEMRKAQRSNWVAEPKAAGIIETSMPRTAAVLSEVWR